MKKSKKIPSVLNDTDSGLIEEPNRKTYLDSGFNQYLVREDPIREQAEVSQQILQELKAIKSQTGHFSKIEPAQKNNVELDKIAISFSENPPAIIAGTAQILLSPHKNEHWLCKAMFNSEIQVGEPVDWSVIYEKITGYYQEYFGKPINKRENWRVVYDTVEALNKRVKKVLNVDSNLFTWQDKTVRRNY